MAKEKCCQCGEPIGFFRDIVGDDQPIHAKCRSIWEAEQQKNSDAERSKPYIEEARSSSEEIPEKFEERQFVVRFSSAFKVDGCGYRDTGQVVLKHNAVIFRGSRSWELLTKIIWFVVLFAIVWGSTRGIDPQTILGTYINLSPVLIIMFVQAIGKVHNRKSTFSAESISGIRVEGRRVTFQTLHPISDRPKEAFLKALNEEDAKVIGESIAQIAGESPNYVGA